MRKAIVRVDCNFFDFAYSGDAYFVRETSIDSEYASWYFDNKSLFDPNRPV